MGYDGTSHSHLVVAPTTTGRLSEMFSGSRAGAQQYIRQRVRNGQPTHFCYVVSNTFRAVDNLKRRVGVNPRGAHPGQDYGGDEEDEFGWGGEDDERGRRTSLRNPPVITTVRLIDKTGYKGGEWFVDPDDSKLLAKIHTDASKARAEEPDMDWHLETRGTHKGWHRWEPHMKPNPRRRYRRNPQTDCKICGGPLMELGSLGRRKHYRCRNCGIDFSKMGRAPRRKRSVYDSRKTKKNSRRRKYGRRRR